MHFAFCILYLNLLFAFSIFFQLSKRYFELLVKTVTKKCRGSDPSQISFCSVQNLSLFFFAIVFGIPCPLSSWSIKCSIECAAKGKKMIKSASVLGKGCVSSALFFGSAHWTIKWTEKRKESNQFLCIRGTNFVPPLFFFVIGFASRILGESCWRFDQPKTI